MDADRRSKLSTIEKGHYSKPESRKDSGEKDPLGKRINISDINDPASRLMDILTKEQSQNLRDRAKSDIEQRALDIIREEDLSAARSRIDLHNTAKFSNTRPEEDNSELKTLDVVEIPLGQ